MLKLSTFISQIKSGFLLWAAIWFGLVGANLLFDAFYPGTPVSSVWAAAYLIYCVWVARETDKTL